MEIQQENLSVEGQLYLCENGGGGGGGVSQANKFQQAHVVAAVPSSFVVGGVVTDQWHHGHWSHGEPL